MAGLPGPTLGLGRRGPSPTKRKSGGSWILLQGVTEALLKPMLPSASSPLPHSHHWWVLRVPLGTVSRTGTHGAARKGEFRVKCRPQVPNLAAGSSMGLLIAVC